MASQPLAVRTRDSSEPRQEAHGCYCSYCSVKSEAKHLLSDSREVAHAGNSSMEKLRQEDDYEFEDNLG